MDLKVELQRLKQDCTKSIKLVPTHIKGHHDRDGEFKYEEASQGTKRNIDMDQLAKSFLKTNQDPLEPK